MIKRNYVKPILSSEAFLPTEYVATCYVVNCNVGSFDELWSESNNVEGLQRTGDNKDTKLLSSSYGLRGCQKWHKGVTKDPEFNGYIYTDSRRGDKVVKVFWWKEDLGSEYDYHASLNQYNDKYSNPNAS